MKRLTIVPAAIAFAIAALPAGGTVARPALHLLQLAPPSIHGTNFAAGERVGVTLRAGTLRISSTVHASQTGQFTVVFSKAATLARCGGTSVSVTAIGTHGERIAVMVPKAACAASPATGTTPVTTTPSMEPPPPYTK